MKSVICTSFSPTGLPRLFLGLVLILSLGQSGPLLGQPSSNPIESEQRWYHVELIVFAQGPGPQSTEEVWQTDIDLEYPRNWVELIDPAERADTAIEGGVSEPEELAPAPGQAVEIDDDTDPGQRALSLLPDQELTLRDQARRLSRSQQHRVLFHEAWHQPMVEDREEPSILIVGGDKFDQHHELEGSVNLYLRTYLHIDVNLWLSQFATNFGQERPPWPVLPTPPNRLLEPGVIPAIDDGGTGLLWRQSDQARDDEYSAILSQPYVVENVALMKQQRRMRSSELHYLDHPLMGVLIKLTPYEPETEQLDGTEPSL